MFVEPGTQFHLHSSVGGKCILAYLPEDELLHVLKDLILDQFTENTVTSKREFRKVLKDVKNKGYAVDNSEDIQGINCVGAPIFNEYGYPVAALWITAPYGRLPIAEFDKRGKTVVKYATEISTKLGYLAQ